MTTSAAMDRLAHTSILASAGSGKTYQLIRRYLGLLAAGESPRSILASTFTRAAAGEILHRLLGQLAAAADDETARRDLAAMLGRETLEADEVLDLLATLTRDLHRLQVRTLDSFFASIVGAFALELGLPPRTTIIDENLEALVRRRAIQLMLEHEPTGRMIDLLRSLTQGTSDKSVTMTIETVVGNLHETWIDSGRAAWHNLPAPPTLDEEALARAIRRLESITPPKQSLADAIAGNAARARDHDWAEFIRVGPAHALARGGTTYRRAPIEEPVRQAYRPLLDHARGELLGLYAAQTRATWELLDTFHRHYVTLKRGRRALTFKDLTVHSAQVVQADARAERHRLPFRLDTTLHHLLLDEMQDTSMQQWRALEPIAREIVRRDPPGRTFFCVGDVKQSIYGWRDAAPEILESMPALLPGATGEPVITTRPLDRSWRSAPAIIETVNRLFGDVGTNAALAKHAEAVREWTGLFSPHETVREGLPGYAELRVAALADDDQKQAASRLREAAALAAELHGRAPRRTIGVLCRTNAAVARTLFELSSLGVTATERGGMPLTNTPAVNAVLDLLRLADHPDDTVSAFHVAASPLGAVVGLDDHADAGRRRAAARTARRDVFEDGLAETLRRWTASIAGACDERELGRLVQLVDLAGRFEGDLASGRLDDFVAVVEETPVADASPSPIQVMTIHQAKGLEFDSVVLPDLEVSLTGERTPLVAVERRGAAGEVTRVCRHMPGTVRDLAPELEPMFRAQTEKIVRESLCVAYVAVTRARQGLYLLVDPAAKLGSRLSGFVAGALCPTATERSPGTLLWQHGDEAWLDAPGTTPDTSVAPATPDERLADSAAPLAPSTTRWSRGRTRPSGHAARGTTLREVLLRGESEATDRGAAVHALFERIEWIETFTPDVTRLIGVVRRTVPRRDEMWARRIVAQFITMLDAPAVRAALSRGDGSAHGRVWRERAYARIVDDQVEPGFIDRLVAWSAAGPAGPAGPSVHPERATVLDYKTDSVEPADAHAAAERYRQQLESYRAAAAEQLGLEPAAIEMQVLFVTPGVLVVLE